MRRQRTPSAVAGTPLLIVLAMAQFMVVLDFTIVNVALPSIQAGLHVGTSTLQWLVSGYAVSFVGFLLLGAGSRICSAGPHVPNRAGCLRVGQRGRRLCRRAGPEVAAVG
jgi:MFS family permease